MEKLSAEELGKVFMMIAMCIGNENTGCHDDNCEDCRKIFKKIKEAMFDGR